MIKRICDCIPIHFPQKEHRVCNFRDIECLNHVTSEFNYKYLNVSKKVNSIECLPECEHYDYPLEVALGKLADNIYVNGLAFFDDVNLKKRSILNVFFNDLVSTKYRRDVYLNWENILAAFGGLLSLMLGFTLISGFDLILFLSIRVFYDYAKTWTQKNRIQNKITVKEARIEKRWTGKSSLEYDRDRH